MQALGPLLAAGRSFTSQKLGRCQRCIRAALLGTVGAWAAATGAALALDQAAVLAATGLIAAALTLLLAAHLVAFALKASSQAAAPCSTCGGKATLPSQGITRRGFVRILAAFTAAGVASLPGVGHVLAQGKGHCDDKTDSKTIKTCKRAGEDDASAHQRNIQEAIAWARARAAELCPGQDCGKARRCVLAHYEISFANEQCLVECRECNPDFGCCEVTVTVKAICRCVGTECASNNLAPPVEVTLSITFGPGSGPPARTREQACKLAQEELDALVQEIGARICEKQDCTSPPNDPGAKCRLAEVKAEVKCRIVGDACECTARILKVHCRC